MKKSFLGGLLFLPLLVACGTGAQDETVPTKTEEVSRKIIQPTEFTKLSHETADTSLIAFDDGAMEDDLPVNIGEMLYGKEGSFENLLIEHRVMRNKSGYTVVQLRSVPRFILIAPDGKATTCEDFRHAEIPHLIERRGRELVVDSYGFCATHTGLITEDFIGLLTPTLHCLDWDDSEAFRHLDLYRLSDGAYLGSIEMPVGEIDTQWIYNLELNGNDLWIHYTDMQSSSLDHYHIVFEIEDAL